MITKRTLEQWRREALRLPEFNPEEKKEDLYFQMLGTINILSQRILRMSQELLDEYLMRGK